MENKEQLSRMPKYRTSNSMFGKGNNAIQSSLNDIDDRLTAIETRIFKTERKTLTTRSQQMLLLKHLGILEILKEYSLSSKKKAKLLSVLLNASQSNIEDDLSIIEYEKSALTTTHNYNIVTKTFKDSGLKKLAEKTDIILDNLIKDEK